MKILIWSDRSVPPAFSGTIILWNEFNVDGIKNHISIPELLDKNRNKFREKYLKLVESIGKIKISNVSLEEYTKIDSEFSLYWMSLPFEKNYGKSQNFYDGIKLVVLEDILVKVKPISITIQRDLANDVRDVLFEYCRNRKIPFQIHERKNSFLKGDLHPYFKNQFLLQLSHALFQFFVILYQNLSIRVLPKQTKHDACELFLFDYFINFGIPKKIPPEYTSQYWGSLLECIRNSRKKIGFHHILIKSDKIPNSKVAMRFLADLNVEVGTQESHNFIQQISWKLLMSVIKAYLLLIIKSFLLRAELKEIYTSDEELNYFSFFKLELFDSLWGATSVENLFYFYFFETILQKTKCEGPAVYLLENQAWERALTYHWKKYVNRGIFGFAHATIRFWDLRYHYSSQFLSFDPNISKILPSKVLVSAKSYTNECKASGYTDHQIGEVEALRYLNLKEVKTDPQSKTLLIFTDYMESATNFQLSLMYDLLLKYRIDYKIIIKNHPAINVNLRQFQDFNFEISKAQASELLEKATIVYTSNITSAAMDAYILGKKVICSFDPATINMSSLLGFENVHFVSDFEELYIALGAKLKRTVRKDRAPYFYLDSNLPKWKKLLNLSSLAKKENS